MRNTYRRLLIENTITNAIMLLNTARNHAVLSKTDSYIVPVLNREKGILFKTLISLKLKKGAKNAKS